MKALTTGWWKCFAVAWVAALSCFAQPAAVERWDTYELAWQGGTYANPFRDVRLTATFRHESGRSVTVNGFYDGGATWRVRFMPLDLGRWSYRTVSKEPALNGKTGEIVCVKPAKPYLHGPLRAQGLHFIHADGSRRFLISTRLSCQFASQPVWDGVILFLNEHRINRVLFIMGGVHGQIKDLYGDGGADLWSYNVARFQAIDRFIDALRRADILASPYFYYFNDHHQRRLTPEQDEAFLRYGMARLGAFANVMPVLANEVEQKSNDRQAPRYDLGSHEWANKMGGILKSLAVFGVPVAVHNPMETRTARNPGFFTLLLDWPFRWADFQLRQMQVGAIGAAVAIRDDVSEPNDPVYHARSYARHNQLLIALRRFGVPVINEEPGYEMEGTHPWNSQTANSVRQTFWTAAVAGAYAMWGNPATYETADPLPQMQRSRTPGYLKTLAETMEGIPYWGMEPMNEIVSPNAEVVDGVSFRTNFALGKPGSAYLVYSRLGGRLAVKLPPGRYTVVSKQLVGLAFAVPGPYEQKVTVQIGGETNEFSTNLRAAYDWVLALKRDRSE